MANKYSCICAQWILAGAGFTRPGGNLGNKSSEAAPQLLLHFGSSKRGCIFNLVVFLSRWFSSVTAVSGLTFQAMSNAKNDSHSIAVGSDDIDMVQYHIDKFDSEMP